MEIAIPAPSSSLPKVKKLAAILRSFGPSKHPIFVFCTPTYRTEVARIFEGMNVTVVDKLTGIVRLPPMSDNEPFSIVMRHMTRTHWFYMTAETIPVDKDWADKLEQEYLASGQSYLGCADYIPNRYRDGSGVDRVVNGAPYILEAAIYPANLRAISKYEPISRVVHHEVARRSEMAPSTHLSSLIGNAKWEDNYRLEHVGMAVVVARVLGTELGDEVLGLSVPDAPPLPEPPAPPPLPEPMKEPTMKIYATMEEAIAAKAAAEILADLKAGKLDAPEEKASQKVEDEVNIAPRRAGRPRKI